MKITMKSVDSSNIQSIGYDKEIKTLVVMFKTGNAYSYSGVSEEDFQKFDTAQSKGQHFAREIRGKYSAEKVEESLQVA